MNLPGAGDPEPAELARDPAEPTPEPARSTPEPGGSTPEPARSTPDPAARPAPEPGAGRPDRRRLDEIFGDVLPETTADERGPSGAHDNAYDDDWFTANRPPHHDR